MQASLSSSQVTQLDTWSMRYEQGISEQELIPADLEDLKVTSYSDTRGDERRESGVSLQFHRASFHVIHGDSR